MCKDTLLSLVNILYKRAKGYSVHIYFTFEYRLHNVKTLSLLSILNGDVAY